MLSNNLLNSPPAENNNCNSLKSRAITVDGTCGNTSLTCFTIHVNLVLGVALPASLGMLGMLGMLLTFWLAWIGACDTPLDCDSICFINSLTSSDE